MARFARRRGAPADAEGDEEAWPGGGEADPVVVSAPVDDLPSHRLRGNEITYGYTVGALVAVASVIMLVVTKGKGAPTHPQPVWAALGVVFGVATVLSIRFSHRLLTSVLAIVGGFTAGQARTPSSLSGVKLVALLAPVAYGVLIFRRQSKVDRARRTAASKERAAQRRAGRSGSRPGGSTRGPAVPGRPMASGRYTPPKARRRGR